MYCILKDGTVCNAYNDVLYLYLQVVIEGIRGVGPQGDIAIDDIIVFRQGDASQPADLVPYGLPVTCKFGVCMCAYC